MADQTFIIPQIKTEISTELHDPYKEAIAIWGQGKSANTRRAYYRALQDLLSFTDKHPSQIRAIDVARWKEELKQRGNSDATISKRLSAVSSYYKFLHSHLVNDQPLQTTNPVSGVGRNDLEVSEYGKAKKLSAEDFKKILNVIDTSKPSGALYRAAFLFYVLCARRRSEVVSLYGRDILFEDDKVKYVVKLKRGKRRKKEMPPPVWQAIQHYIYSTERTLKDDEPVFVAPKKYNRSNGLELKPIHGGSLLYALKRYAKKAGLNPKSVDLHSLRHLGAELFLKESNDVHETQTFLDHAHLNTTQIYLHQPRGDTHRHWQGMANELDVE